MNLVIRFISNIINTVFVLGLVFIAIIIITLINLVLLPTGCVGCILKTKSIKNIPRYIKKVIEGTCEETDEFFYHMSNSLKYIWRVE